MTQETQNQSNRDSPDLRENKAQQQQQGESSKSGQFGGQRQQQQSPGKQPAPGGGEPEVQEELPEREDVSERGTRTPPSVDVERP